MIRHTITRTAVLVSFVVVATSCSYKHTTISVFSNAEITEILEAINSIRHRQAKLEKVGVYKELIYDESEIESIKSSARTWTRFATLCKKRKFMESYEYLESEGRMIDVLIHLRHPSNRYEFLSKVLKPLVRAFDDNGLVKYIDMLELEVELQDSAITYDGDEVTFLPETYPVLLMELGTSYMEIGREDEAFALVRAVDEAFTIQTNSRPVAALLALSFNAKLLLMKEDVDAAAECMDIFVSFIENNTKEISPEDSEGLKNRAAQIKKSIMNYHEIQ